MTGKTPVSPGRAAHSNGSRYAVPTGLSPVETGDAPHEVPAVLGRTPGPSGTPKQETLRPAPLSAAQPLWMPVHACPISLQRKGGPGTGSLRPARTLTGSGALNCIRIWRSRP